MVDELSGQKLVRGENLPFPMEWVKTQPRKVEDALSGLSVEEQVRCILGLNPLLQQNLLMLSEKAVEVTRALPVEEVYNLIKEVGKEDSLLVLSMVSSEQLQYFFDVEWWQEDKLQPQRVLEWIVLLDQCQDPETLNWFLGEDFDQKVMLLQALIKVFKKDEMTDSYDGIEGLEHFTPDGVYDIFFKVENNKELRKLLLLLAEKDQKIFYDLLESVIWFPVTPTLEKAYQWKLSRTSERGIPEFQEAVGIYSRLEPESLKLKLLSQEDLSVSRFGLSPQYLLAQLDETHFLTQCLAKLEDQDRIESLRWELICIANKVIVADRLDMSLTDIRNQAFRKTMGYINIGLELGAEGDFKKGVSLLDRVWMLSLFQVGFEQLRQIRSSASTFIKENGSYIEYFISSGDKERLGALVFQFPQIAEKLQDSGSFLWRDPESIKDIQVINEFIERWKFYSRFLKQSLDLSEAKFSSLLDHFDASEFQGSLNVVSILTTVLAQYVLFNRISFDLLNEVSAKSFLDMIFLPGIFQDEGKICDEDRIAAFEKQLMLTPMAWTDSDKNYLHYLLQECRKNLEAQFGSLNFSRPIEWKFLQGICIDFGSEGRKK
jgi:hypothetical protein